MKKPTMLGKRDVSRLIEYCLAVNNLGILRGETKDRTVGILAFSPEVEISKFSRSTGDRFTSGRNGKRG